MRDSRDSISISITKYLLLGTSSLFLVLVVIASFLEPITVGTFLVLGLLCLLPFSAFLALLLKRPSAIRLSQLSLLSLIGFIGRAFYHTFGPGSSSGFGVVFENWVFALLFVALTIGFIAAAALFLAITFGKPHMAEDSRAPGQLPDGVSPRFASAIDDRDPEPVAANTAETR